MKSLLSILVLAIPILVMLHLAYPGEWEWYESISGGVVSVMLSNVWHRFMGLIPPQEFF